MNIYTCNGWKNVNDNRYLVAYSIDIEYSRILKVEFNYQTFSQLKASEDSIVQPGH